MAAGQTMRDSPGLVRIRYSFRRRRVFALLNAAAALVAALALSASLRAQTALAPGAIGSLVGDDVAVKGAISFDVAGGRSSALLASGSEITVRSGKARIDLGDVDTIAVCGPAHFTIIKAGDTFTLALDYGQVHPQLTSAVALTIYMPLIVATPVAIGPGPRDLTVGLDQAGALCAVTALGAVRIEQQLAGQGMLVPQGGQVSFNGGELNTIRNSSQACGCELLVVADTVKKQFTMNLQVQPPVQPAAIRPPLPPAPVPSDAPVYRITVPLTFDARSPAPPAADPPTIVVDEEARLETKFDFGGNIGPSPPPPPATSLAKIPATDEPEKKKPNVFARFFGLFRHRRTEASCAGAGCGQAN